MPQRKGCGMMESIGLKNVGEKLESKLIYGLNYKETSHLVDLLLC